MAQNNGPIHVVVPVKEEGEYESHLQQLTDDPTIDSPDIQDLGVPVQRNSSTCPPELTKRPHKDSLNLHRALKSEEMMESCSSHTTVRRNSKLSVKHCKSRLEDPKWSFNSLAKEDDWFLDDVLEGAHHLKKTSLLTIFQLACLALVMVIFACTLSIAKSKTYKLWDLPLWKWEILISVIISGHLISGWGVRIVVFTIEGAFLSNIRVMYFVYGMRKAVQHCIWLGLIVIAWHYLMAEKMARQTKSKILHYVSKVLLCLLVGSFVWLVKVVVVKVLASSFHDKTFFQRTQIYLFKQYVLKKLSVPPKDSWSEDEVRSTGEPRLLQYLRGFPNLQGQISSNNEQCKHFKRKGSAPKLKRLIGQVQRGFLSPLSTLDEDLPDSSDDEDEESLCNNARKKAKKIFENVAKGSEFFVLEDLKQYMVEDKASLARSFFKEISEKGRVKKESFINWTVDAIKERRSLLLSLNDSKTAIDELHHLMNGIIAIFIVIIWLIIFELAISHLLVFLTSQLVLVVFIFGNTCKTVFEAIIFLFIMHPFDVGDRCEVDEIQMVVEEMNILTTAFERYDGQKIIYPNSVLASKPIGNYKRSPHMGDQIQFSIHISTPWDKIMTMKEEIKRYIESNEKHWYCEPVIIVKDVEDMNLLIMVVWPRHKMNHQDMLQRWVRRALLIDEMIKIFRKLDIEYHMLPMDLNVRKIAGTASNKPPSNWTTCIGDHHE